MPTNDEGSSKAGVVDRILDVIEVIFFPRRGDLREKMERDRLEMIRRNSPKELGIAAPKVK